MVVYELDQAGDLTLDLSFILIFHLGDFKVLI